MSPQDKGIFASLPHEEPQPARQSSYQIWTSSIAGTGQSPLQGFHIWGGWFRSAPLLGLNRSRPYPLTQFDFFHLLSPCPPPTSQHPYTSWQQTHHPQLPRPLQLVWRSSTCLCCPPHWRLPVSGCHKVLYGTLATTIGRAELGHQSLLTNIVCTVVQPKRSILRPIHFIGKCLRICFMFLLK